MICKRMPSRKAVSLLHVMMCVSLGRGIDTIDEESIPTGGEVHFDDNPKYTALPNTHTDQVQFNNTEDTNSNVTIHSSPPDIGEDDIRFSDIHNNGSVKDDIRNDDIHKYDTHKDDIIKLDIRHSDSSKDDIVTDDIRNGDIVKYDIIKDDIRNDDIHKDDTHKDGKDDIITDDIRNGDIRNGDTRSGDTHKDDIIKDIVKYDIVGLRHKRKASRFKYKYTSRFTQTRHIRTTNVGISTTTRNPSVSIPSSDVPYNVIWPDSSNLRSSGFCSSVSPNCTCVVYSVSGPSTGTSCAGCHGCNCVTNGTISLVVCKCANPQQILRCDCDVSVINCTDIDDSTTQTMMTTTTKYQTHPTTTSTIDLLFERMHQMALGPALLGCVSLTALCYCMGKCCA